MAGYSTLAQAREYAAPGFGTCADDPKMVDVVNKIRQRFFFMYDEVGLFLDVVECFRLHRFEETCNACRDGYVGITLPRDMQTVEAAWVNDAPIMLQSAWREFQVGIKGECNCGLEKFDVAGSFPTAIDLKAWNPQRVIVRAFDEADIGKRFLIRGRASTGQPVTLDLKLTTEPQQIDVPLAAIDRAGGILKDRTVGRVVLLDEASQLLGMYEPDETIPAYRRVKITGVHPNCDVVNIRAARRYFPLYNDDDVVESDNAMAFDAMARYLRIYEMSGKSADQARDMAVYYSTAQKAMLGEKSRDLGKATQGAVSIATPSFAGPYGHGLNRTGGRIRW